MLTAIATKFAGAWVAQVEQENEMLLIQTSTEEGARKIAQALNTFARHVLVVEKE